MTRVEHIGFLASILILQVSGQCTLDNIVFSSDSYQGHVLVDTESFFLAGDQGGEGEERGIHIEAGCKDAAFKDDVKLVVTDDYFVLEDVLKIEKTILKLSPLVSHSKLFPFQKYEVIVKASSRMDPTISRTVVVTVGADDVINAHAPSFNYPVFYGSLDLAGCPDTPTDTCDVKPILEHPLDVTDEDPGQSEIEYLLDAFTPHATQFKIDTKTGEISYIGLQNSFSEDVDVVLIVKAVEQRPDGRSTSVPVVIAVTAAETEAETTTAASTEPPSPGDCEETDLERKYFISMIVLGAVLSGLLTALLLLILFCCCKRCCGGGGGGGGSGRADIVQATKASMKHSGVMAEGAVFKSFKDTTYLTLQSQHSPASNRSTNDWDSSNSLPRYEPRTRYEDTDSTASAGYAARRRN